ncbi:MAG TPA: protoporphyrinogen oxidase [Acidobacteriaceae bacterium]|nr:protoporphyrinogen oxidase [Acidobacteriaceae bacterium]
MKRIAILGGGIAGLSAAWTLERARRAGQEIEYRLYEAAGRLGGVIASETVDGCVVEAGPDSFLTEKPAASQLCREIGLGDQLMGSHDAERKTYIVVGKRLIPLPDGLMFMVPTRLMPTALTPLFSLRTKLQMAREFLFPPEPATSDESVAEMTRRHFGQETVDRLVSPLLAGVYGGDADQLSVRAVLARMAQMEQKHRSLTRGMLVARKQRAKAPALPLFTTLRGGMSQMVDAIAAQLPPDWVHLSTEVHAIARRENAAHRARREPADWMVETAFGREMFDALILALPAWGSASLLRPIDHPLAEALSGVPYSSSITVTLGYEIGRLLSLPPGFGFLVPSTEKRALLACTFVHAKFAGRVPAGKGLLRCFLGGASHDELLDESDARLTVMVLKELEQILGLKAPPSFVSVHRSRQAMAQYGVGHLERIQLVRDRIAELPGIALAGNAYRGIGVPDCIHTGQQAAESALRTVSGAAVGAGTC